MSIFGKSSRCNHQELKELIEPLEEEIREVRRHSLNGYNSWSNLVRNLHDRVRRIEIEFKMDPKYCLSCKKDIKPIEEGDVT